MVAVGQVAAEGDGWIVAYDYRKHTKVTIPPTLRAAIQSLEASVHARAPG